MTNKTSKVRKVLVLERVDNNISDVRLIEKVYETDQTTEQLAAHAHVHAILQDPYVEKKVETKVTK